MTIKGLQSLKLLSVNPMYYDSFEQCTFEVPKNWQAFHAENAYNLCVNSYVLLCVPMKARIINPYYESLFSAQCTYLKKLDELVQRHAQLMLITKEQKWQFACAVIERLDQEAARRHFRFESDLLSTNRLFAHYVEQQQWSAIDRAFLAAQKADVVQFLHLMNAQRFLEQVVESLVQNM